MNLDADVTVYSVGGLRKGEMLSFGSGVATSRSLTVAEHAAACANTELTDSERETLARHDIMEMDFTEIELRVLAHMREDAEKMDDTDEFRRPEDLMGYDTAKVRTLLSLKDAQKILKEKGCQIVRDPKKIAAKLFDIDESEVTEAQRQFAKTFYFGELYGNPQSFAESMESRGLP